MLHGDGHGWLVAATVDSVHGGSGSSASGAPTRAQPAQASSRRGLGHVPASRVWSPSPSHSISPCASPACPSLLPASRGPSSPHSGRQPLLPRALLSTHRNKVPDREPGGCRHLPHAPLPPAPRTFAPASPGAPHSHTASLCWLPAPHPCRGGHWPVFRTQRPGASRLTRGGEDPSPTRGREGPGLVVNQTDGFRPPRAA